MDPAFATVVVAGIAAFTSIITAIISVWDRKKIKETHAQVTVNGGTSRPPTVLDKLSEIEGAVKETNHKVDTHILWHLENRNH